MCRAVGRLGVAACLACVAAAAADRRARQSCLVWCGGVIWPPARCVLRRSESGGRTAQPDTLRHRPDTERTCMAVACRADSINSHRHTRHDKTVLSVSCMGYELDNAINVFRFQIFCRRQSWVFVCRVSNSHSRSGRDSGDTDKTVLSCLAWRCEVALTSICGRSTDADVETGGHTSHGPAPLLATAILNSVSMTASICK